MEVFYHNTKVINGVISREGGGGGQLAQIFGRYVPRQNQKVDP